jgi:protease-4
MVMVIVAAVGIASGGESGFSGVGEKVGVVTVEGVISASAEQGLLGGAVGGVRQTLKQLKRAEEDDSIKAVVLRINSPGGSAAASQEIYHEVQRLAEKKPVVASMADVAASGGYYIALPAKTIIANQATMTGSIGVRMSYLQYYELMHELGVDGGNITSGPYKDIGTPWRDMTEDERSLLQGMIDNIYQQFVEHVSESRELEIGKAKELADGRIFTGEQALDEGLIDELGGFNHAVKVAGELGGIEGEPEVRDIKGGTSFFDLMSAQSRQMTRAAMQRALENALRDMRVEDAEGMLQVR